MWSELESEVIKFMKKATLVPDQFSDAFHCPLSRDCKSFIKLLAKLKGLWIKHCTHVPPLIQNVSSLDFTKRDTPNCQYIKFKYIFTPVKIPEVNIIIL